MVETAVLLLAGGEARRFPGKLERCIDGEPMLQRCYNHAKATGWPVIIAAKGSFPAEIDARLDAPLLIDRRTGGPLQALIDACALIPARNIVAMAADQPRLDAEVLGRLTAVQQANDEALVPTHDGWIEPLAAVYQRIAVLRESWALRAAGKGAMRDLIERLATRFLALPSRYFHNVNRPADLRDS